MKKYFSYPTIVGTISIVEDAGNIVRITLSGEMQSALKEETPLIKKMAAQLAEYFEGKRKTFDLPLNPEGTDFQRSIWNELVKVPYGQTRSYKDIAVAAGNPKAARAVGMANNRNPLMIVVPCHRIVGANGSLTGYAGGLDVKERLLELERTAP